MGARDPVLGALADVAAALDALAPHNVLAALFRGGQQLPSVGAVPAGYGLAIEPVPGNPSTIHVRADVPNGAWETIDWGDGSPPNTGGFTGGVDATHEYGRPGTYGIFVEFTTYTGKQRTPSVPVTVFGGPPGPPPGGCPPGEIWDAVEGRCVTPGPPGPPPGGCPPGEVWDPRAGRCVTGTPPDRPPEPLALTSAEVVPAYGPAPLSVAGRWRATGGKQPYGELWDWGDGARSEDARHVYDRPGAYQVTFFLSDATGARTGGPAGVVTTTGEAPPGPPGGPGGPRCPEGQVWDARLQRCVTPEPPRRGSTLPPITVRQRRWVRGRLV